MGQCSPSSSSWLQGSRVSTHQFNPSDAKGLVAVRISSSLITGPVHSTAYVREKRHLCCACPKLRPWVAAVFLTQHAGLIVDEDTEYQTASVLCPSSQRHRTCLDFIFRTGEPRMAPHEKHMSKAGTIQTWASPMLSMNSTASVAFNLVANDDAGAFNSATLRSK